LFSAPLPAPVFSAPSAVLLLLFPVTTTTTTIFISSKG
jgi:hypothetical protein